VFRRTPEQPTVAVGVLMRSCVTASKGLGGRTSLVEGATAVVSWGRAKAGAAGVAPVPASAGREELMMIRHSKSINETKNMQWLRTVIMIDTSLLMNTAGALKESFCL
jgi:hypothetical protein